MPSRPAQLPTPVLDVHPGRQRRAHQRRGLVAARTPRLRARSSASRRNGADAMIRSWRAGTAIDTDAADTYADGIATRVAIPRAVALMAGRVDAMLTVSEDDLHAAQAVLTDGARASPWKVPRPRPGPASSPRMPRPGRSSSIVTGSNI